MKVVNSGRAVPVCCKLPLNCLSAGVIFSIPSCPTSLFVKLEDGCVLSVPSFKKQYGYECQGTTEVIPHPEAVLTVCIGEYDPSNPDNKYYKSGTEPICCESQIRLQSLKIVRS